MIFIIQSRFSPPTPKVYHIEIDLDSRSSCFEGSVIKLTHGEPVTCVRCAFGVRSSEPSSLQPVRIRAATPPGFQLLLLFLDLLLLFSVQILQLLLDVLGDLHLHQVLHPGLRLVSD